MAGSNKDEIIEQIIDQMSDPDAVPQPTDPSSDLPDVTPPPSEGASSYSLEQTEAANECWMLAIKMAESAKPFFEYRNRYVEPRMEEYDNGKILYGIILVEYVNDLWIKRRHEVQWLAYHIYDPHPELRL